MSRHFCVFASQNPSEAILSRVCVKGKARLQQKNVKMEKRRVNVAKLNKLQDESLTRLQKKNKVREKPDCHEFSITLIIRSIPKINKS
jgi:hypothetical protein